MKQILLGLLLAAPLSAAAQALTPDVMQRITTANALTRQDVALRNALAANGIDAIATKAVNPANTDLYFSHEAPSKGITDQQSSGRCWLFTGPIDRSRRFLADWNRVLPRADYMELCGKGIWKLLLGAVYKMVLAAGAYKIMGYLETGTAWYHWIGYAYAYGMYLFFDFAGYSLMAVGSSYVLGIETPDNFNMPFISRDIREFWDRWHITLSHWFRDFIFTRFVMYSSKKKWFSSRLQRACAGFFVDMGIMGLWHGITPSYILYGLYHGLLLAATETYQKKSSFYKRNKNKTWYQILSWAITMQLVMFGFFLFSGKLMALFGW